MESYIIDWLNLLFRWLHLITGAAWIGTSFYFNWLNHNIRPLEEEKDEIKGGLFAIHGGAFYQVLKYKGAPARLPETLHWFKWEAYFTWITGIGLMAVVYYWNASLYLTEASPGAFTPAQAIGISLLYIIGGWFFYDGLCLSDLRKNPVAFTVVGFLAGVGIAISLTYLFPPRAAYIHFGVILGTIMAGNVFFVIIPNQRAMVDAMIEGREPDISKGAAGALRSLHNNYFTLPVLFLMVSNHFPMTFGHQYNWAILAAISLIGVGVRHHFNLKHKGHYNVWILPTAAVAIFALAWVIRPTPPAPRLGGAALSLPAKVTYDDIRGILATRCVPCHAAKPTFPGFTVAPQGSLLETHAQAKALRDKMRNNVITTKTMPPGNLTKMTDQERDRLGTWLEAGTP